MRRAVATGAILCAAALIATVAWARVPKREPPPPPRPAGAQIDKRDRLVAAPNTPFHGQPYWQALGQCGGIYFKLNTIYSNAALNAQVVKPDRAAFAQLSKQAREASRTATAFFTAAELFLMADRGIMREEAVLIYDVKASEAGDRPKTADAAIQAAKGCTALYQTCRGSFGKICSETLVSAN